MRPNQIIAGDIRTVSDELPSNFVNCIITSPPYLGQRDYNVDGQIGKESTVDDYVLVLQEVFFKLKRVLSDDGTLWLNLGDAYDKSTKQLLGIPWQVVFALQKTGWVLRMDVVWHKPAPMPESVTDRPTKAHEYLFLFSKGKTYYYDAEAIKEPVKESTKNRATRGHWKYGGNKAEGYGKQTYSGNAVEAPKLANKRSVWTIDTASYPGAHYAVFPEDLVLPCLLAGCPPNGLVLDPFFGSGTVGQVAIENGRNWLGVELNPDYIAQAEERIAGAKPALFAMGTIEKKQEGYTGEQLPFC